MISLLEEFNRPFSINWVNLEKLLMNEREDRSLPISLKSNKRQILRNVPALIARGQGGPRDVRFSQIETNL